MNFKPGFTGIVKILVYRGLYIKKTGPHLNGKVELSHLSDQREFYQLLEYTDDIDIEKKLIKWEIFYNSQRPNGALWEKTPYEALREKLLPKDFSTELSSQ